MRRRKKRTQDKIFGTTRDDLTLELLPSPHHASFCSGYVTGGGCNWVTKLLFQVIIGGLAYLQARPLLQTAACSFPHIWLFFIPLSKDFISTPESYSFRANYNQQRVSLNSLSKES